MLWYSAQYRDWDVTNGSIAQEASPTSTLHGSPHMMPYASIGGWAHLNSGAYAAILAAMCILPTSIWAVDSLVVLLQDDILMFGGGGGRESRPQYVQNEWSLATEFIKDYAGSVQLLPAALSADA